MWHCRKVQWLPTFLLFALLAPAAQALCTSEGTRAPTAVLERFLNADCEDCWRAADTPKPAPGAIALDWVLPGARGDEAPLASVALPEAAGRLASLRRLRPATTEAVASRRQGGALPLRLAQGQSFNDYLGTSISLRAEGTWQAWLLLVEKLPAGVEGSAVERLLVRNVFRPDWSAPAAQRSEQRSMQIHAGAAPERLRLVAIVEDARGRIRAIRQTECR
jgi:hypothetical protein